MLPRLEWRRTTVICVRLDGRVAMASDGQVTHGTTVMKHTAAKIRRLKGGDVIAGFALGVIMERLLRLWTGYPMSPWKEHDNANP